MIHMPDEPVTVERVVDGQLRVLGHDKARVEAEPSRCDACDCAGARKSSSLRGEWSRPSRGRPRRSRPRAACARVCGSGSEPARPKIDDAVRLAPVAAQHGRWPALADMPAKAVTLDGVVESSEGGVRGQVHAALGPLIEAVRTLDMSASHSWAEFAAGSIPSAPKG